jgi:hypothetical protein
MSSTAANAQDDADEAAAMARTLQDPLAYISAIMTDNDIYIGTGDGQATTVLQIQPVYSLNYDSLSVIPRAVIPVIGLAPEAKIPPIGEPAPSGESTLWGLGDTAVQAFIAPKTESAWKWGVGPQVSLRTHTRSSHAGAGWGGGLAGVLVGGFGENVSVAVIGGHMWGQDGFSTTLLQPNVYYNFPSIPGMAIAYNAAITYDHNISSGDKLQLPLGATLSKTSSLGGGYGLEMAIGTYVYPIKPDGGPDWSFKFQLSMILPRD